MWPFTAYELRLVANRDKWDAYIIRWVFIRAVESTEAVNRCEGEEVRRPLYWSSAILKQCITLSSPAPPTSPDKPTLSAVSSQGEAMVLHGTFWRAPSKIYDPIWSFASLSFLFCLPILQTLYSSRTFLDQQQSYQTVRAQTWFPGITLTK